jgi:hypothetical protein
VRITPALVVTPADAADRLAKQAGIGSRESCPVTVPPRPPFVPPDPYPREPDGDGAVWYGSSALWTTLRIDGNYDDTAFWKMFWWSEGYSWTSEPSPPLVVSARRLDGESMAIEVMDATNGYHPDLGSFMLTGIRLPTGGCWEFTGRYRDAEVTFIGWVR